MHQRLLQLSWFFYVKKYPVSKKEDSEMDEDGNEYVNLMIL